MAGAWTAEEGEPMKMLFPSLLRLLSICLIAAQLSACTPFSTEPVPGPDKQGSGVLYGAASGAGAGAIIGANLTAATGPGAFIGAGFGALFGMMSGIQVDMLEENEIDRIIEQRELRELSWVQKVLIEHYSRRLEIHPSRDIYPADWFFAADSNTIRPEARRLVEEIGKSTRDRMPWSRVVVSVYSTAADSDSSYADYVTRRRSEELSTAFVSAGLEPRRIIARGVTLPEPILIDPSDAPDRYKQAVEISYLDR